jgi:hypothetical protein
MRFFNSVTLKFLAIETSSLAESENTGSVVVRLSRGCIFNFFAGDTTTNIDTSEVTYSKFTPAHKIDPEVDELTSI